MSASSLLSFLDAPVVVGDRVYVADKAGILLALALKDGKVLWQFETGSGFSASPAVAGDRLVISTNGSFSVSGASGRNEDLIVFNPTSFGSSTSGSFDLYFDGSDVGLNSSDEDVNGTWINSVTNEIYLTLRGLFFVTGASGDQSDISVCLPTSQLHPHENHLYKVLEVPLQRQS